MLAVENTLLVLLAAGWSRRFGEGASKLDQNLGGLPLGLHPAATLGTLPFRQRLAVIGDVAADYARYGFEAVANPQRDEGMASSVRLGAARAQQLGVEAILIALADMPCITAAHVLRLFDASEGATTVVASSAGQALKPPVLLGCGHFARLLDLSGDAGARDLLKGGRHVTTTPAELIDVDTPEELAKLRALLAAA